MALDPKLRADIERWLRKHNRQFVVVLGEESNWWSAADVDDVLASLGRAPAESVERPEHYPDITPARPRPPLDRSEVTPVAAPAALVREAQASIALDGQTFAVEEEPQVVEEDQPAAEQQPAEPAHITVDVGEVVGPDPEPVVQPPSLVDQQLVDQVDDTAADDTEVAHPGAGLDVLAAGLAHPDPDVVAAARKAAAAIDRLITALQRKPRTPRSRA